MMRKRPSTAYEKFQSPARSSLIPFDLDPEVFSQPRITRETQKTRALSVQNPKSADFRTFSPPGIFSTLHGLGVRSPDNSPIHSASQKRPQTDILNHGSPKLQSPQRPSTCSTSRRKVNTESSAKLRLQQEPINSKFQESTRMPKLVSEIAAQNGNSETIEKPKRPSTALCTTKHIINQPQRVLRPYTASASRSAYISSEVKGLSNLHPQRSRPVSGKIHTSRSNKDIDKEYVNLKNLVGLEQDMINVAKKASNEGLFQLIKHNILPPSVDFSKQLLDSTLISTISIKPTSNPEYFLPSRLESYSGMVKYHHEKNNEVFNILANPTFMKTTPSTPKSVSAHTTPIGTPNWTPNTAGYQQSRYPPARPFYQSSQAQTPHIYYPEPLQTPIETLKHLSHLVPPDVCYVMDWECFSICNGKLVDTSPSFVHFQTWVKRQNYFAQGVSLITIMFFIRKMEAYFQFHMVEWAEVCISKMLRFLSQPILVKITSDDMVNCLANKEEVFAFLNSPGHIFRCTGGALSAANKLAEIARANLIRKRHLRVLRDRKIAEYVVYYRRRILKLRILHDRIKARLVSEKQKCKELADIMKANWNIKYAGKKRFVIHIPSITSWEARTTMSNIKPKQLGQLGRFKDLSDPDVTIIYVTYPMEADVEDSFKTYLQQFAFDQFCFENETLISRFHVVVPENYVFFRKDSSITSMLLASRHALNRIRDLVGNFPAYIVPGVVGESDVSLSAILEIPLMSDFETCQPFLFNIAYQTDYLSRCDVTTPPGEIIREDETPNGVLASLFSLMKNYQFIDRWIFKINYHTEQTGIAYWDSQDISLHSNESDEVLSEKIQRNIISKAKFVQSNSPFESMIDYLNALAKFGGVVQGAPPVFYEDEHLVVEKAKQEFPTRFPSAHFIIEPDGTSKIICTSDELSITPYKSWGVLIPQHSCDSNELFAACDEVLNKLKDRGYFGYITVDFVLWDAHATNCRHLWCIGVKPYLTESAVYCMNFLMAISSRMANKDSVKSGRVVLDMNQSRKISFRYLSNNKFVDLEKVKRDAKMALYEGDEDLVDRVGIYSQNYQHFGFSPLTAIGLETLCLDSGLSLHLKKKIGVMTVNVDRCEPDKMSMICSDESTTKCLEHLLIGIVMIYRRLMTIEEEEASNFLDIAYMICSELRRSRHRDAVFEKDSNFSADAEFYKVSWKRSNFETQTSQQFGNSSYGIAINIEDAEVALSYGNLPIATRTNSHMLLSTSTSNLPGAINPEESFLETNLSPLRSVTNSELNVFISSSTDAITLLTTAENQQMKRRLASNPLEEIVAQVIELPDYTQKGLDDFSPIHRIRLVNERKTNNQKSLPAILPDPKSIALLNSLIPSDSLWIKFADYGEFHEPTLMLPERENDPERIPLGLPISQYLDMVEQIGILREQKQAMEQARLKRIEDEKKREESRRKQHLAEEKALKELEVLISKEKAAYEASGKALTKKIQEEIEIATRQYFFELQNKQKSALERQQELDAEAEAKRLKSRRITDFMGKKKRLTVGGMVDVVAESDADVEVDEVNVSSRRRQSSLAHRRRSSMGVTVLPAAPMVQSVTMRVIGERMFGFRSDEQHALSAVKAD